MKKEELTNQTIFVCDCGMYKIAGRGHHWSDILNLYEFINTKFFIKWRKCPTCCFLRKQGREAKRKSKERFGSGVS
jgi:hypothetical protein